MARLEDLRTSISLMPRAEAIGLIEEVRKRRLEGAPTRRIPEDSGLHKVPIKSKGGNTMKTLDKLSAEQLQAILEALKGVS